VIDGVAVARGSRVRLAPCRRADAQDFLLRDRAALVAGVFEDLDGRTYLGVTLEDDPAAEWMPGHGRYYYFFPDEVVPMEQRGREDPRRRRRQPVSRRRRLRGRGRASRPALPRPRWRHASWTRASAACTSPTSSSTATTR
jgi:hypothetical protein